MLVIEEDYEIGTPEHCGGLVSITGLEELGIIPFRKTFDHMIESAEQLQHQMGIVLQLIQKSRKLVEISRRELDKQIAFQAQKNGAIIKVRDKFSRDLQIQELEQMMKTIDCKIFVDARGVSSLIHKDRTGIIVISTI